MFVNASLDHVADTADRASLTILQLHGDEGPAYCREAARRTGCRVMKAARVRGPADITALRAFGTDFHLLDAYVPGHPGGTGESFNWDPPSHWPRGAGGAPAPDPDTPIAQTSRWPRRSPWTAPVAPRPSPAARTPPS